MTRIGLDIGVTTGGDIVWAVFADARPLRRRACSPEPMSARPREATIAVGLGANVLVGGSNHSVALQPLSVQGQVGLNVAAGIGDLWTCICVP